MFKTSIIYAAGQGTRLRPLTEYVPKALVQINKKRLIEYSINFLTKKKIKNIFVTYGYKGEQLLLHLHNKVTGFINTTNCGNSYFLFNSTISYTNEPILCLPCDIIFKINLKRLYNNYLKIGEPPIALVPVSTNICRHGDKITTIKKNTVIRVDKQNIAGNICASGIQIINPSKVKKLMTPKSDFSDVWKNLIKSQQLLVTDVMPKMWITFDTLKQISDYE